MPTFSHRELTRRGALTEADLGEIGQCRRPHNQLGFAYQLCFVRLLSRFPIQEPFELIDDLVLFVALQLGKEPELIDAYLGRQATRSDHQQWISAYLGLRRFEARDEGVLEQEVFEAAMRLEQPSGLARCVDEFLVEHKLLRPADSSLTRMIGQQRRRAREHIFSRITDLLPVATAEKLDALLVVPDGASHSPIHTIKMNSGYPSASAMTAALEKLRTIEGTEVLVLDLSWLNSNYQRALFHKVRKKTAHQLRETSAPVRYAALVCFLRQSYGDAIDQAVLMFSKLLTRAEARASASLGETMRDEKSSIKDGLSALASMGPVVLGDDPELGLREKIFESVSREELAESVQYAIGWISGRKSDQRQMLVERYRSLRRYGPAFLEAIGLEPEMRGEGSPILDAISVLRSLNAAGKRKVPEDAPMDFLSTRWRRTVSRDGQISRPAWECALLLKTRDEIRGGNLAVRHSKRFGHLDDLFMPEAQWTKVRQGFFSRAELPGSAADVPAYLSQRLHAAFERFGAAAQANTYASVDEKGWRLSVDPAEKMSDEEQERLDTLKNWLGEHARRIRLPDLLIEVDNDLGFSRMFMPMSRRASPSADEICTIVAAVMAQGCNIGAHTMAQLTSGVTYEQLKRVGDWQLTRDNGEYRLDRRRVRHA